MPGYAELCSRMPRVHFQLILSKIRAKKPYLGITLQIMVIKSSKNVVKMGRFYYRRSAGSKRFLCFIQRDRACWNMMINCYKQKPITTPPSLPAPRLSLGSIKLRDDRSHHHEALGAPMWDLLLDSLSEKAKVYTGPRFSMTSNSSLEAAFSIPNSSLIDGIHILSIESNVCLSPDAPEFEYLITSLIFNLT